MRVRSLINFLGQIFYLQKNKSFQFESDYPVFLNNPTIKRINLIKKINFSYSDFDFYFNY